MLRLLYLGAPTSNAAGVLTALAREYRVIHELARADQKLRGQSKAERDQQQHPETRKNVRERLAARTSYP